MKQVLAYVSLDGSLHYTKYDATLRSLQHLVEDGSGQAMSYRLAISLFKNRKEIIEMFTNIEEQKT